MTLIEQKQKVKERGKSMEVMRRGIPEISLRQSQSSALCQKLSLKYSSYIWVAKSMWGKK